MTNRKAFFDHVRMEPFGGRLKPSQVDGLTRILDYREKVWPDMPDNELAYVLATVKWETGHSMQPIEEGFPMTGEKLRTFQRRLRYFPFYGRGLVQITHPGNYDKFGVKEHPEKALEWPTALDILFRGMIFGMFTEKKLADFFSAESSDWISARSIVNGQDRATEIADIAKQFFAAITAAKDAPVQKPAAAQEHVPVDGEPTVDVPHIPIAMPALPSAALVVSVLNIIALLIVALGLISIKADIKALRADAMQSAILTKPAATAPAFTPGRTK